MSSKSLEQLLEHYEEDRQICADQDVKRENIDHIPADDVVSVYFRQMAVEPLLTPEQEIALGRRIERGCKAADWLAEEDDWTSEEFLMLKEFVQDGRQAREHLARANTRLVVSIAKRYRNQGMPMSDLIQEGNVGLMKAVDKFDYTMGNRFSTYASWWIRQTISRALSQKSRTIRLPLHINSRLRRITTAKEVLGQELGRKPTYKEIGKHLNLSIEEVRDTMEHTPQTIPIDTPVGEDGELSQFIEDEDATGPDDAIHDIAMSDTLDSTLDSILPREAKILRLRFGLKGDTPQTLEQVGKVMGLSRERIRQIERQALRRLRQPQYASKLHDFWSE